jgi:hypothetical protein
LIFAKRLERIPCLFSVGFCPSGIAGKALEYRQGYLSHAPFEIRSKVELSLSDLQQTNGLTEIPFKSQLSELGYEGIPVWSLPVYFW